MLFKNRRRLHSNDARASYSPTGFAPGNGEISDWIWVRVLNQLTGLVLWILLIVAGGGLATGYLTLRGCGKSAVQQENEAGRPIRSDTVLYSSNFSVVVENAARQRRELLTDYATFCLAWGEHFPGEPMMLKMVGPVTNDPGSKKVLRALNGPTVVVDAKNFAEIRPLLADIKTLILKRNATGRGRLPVSGYEAEPAELQPDRFEGKTK
jgi:hypothetical protein